MCCFSSKVRDVANTRIFARRIAAERQALVYAMHLDAPQDVAMILPIPVKPGTPEDGVKFVDFSGIPEFFGHLASGFPSREADGPFAAVAGGTARQLQVVSVGSYDASFVPAVKDFSRLDPRFRLPAGVWEKLGQYADYGFAVFKLKAGKSDIHPMAFDFPSRHPDRLFFPTVHIHDGQVHPKEEFDHSLYFQTTSSGLRELLKWEESPTAAVTFARAGKTHGFVDPSLHVRRGFMRGEQENRDVLLPFA